MLKVIGEIERKGRIVKYDHSSSRTIISTDDYSRFKVFDNDGKYILSLNIPSIFSSNKKINISLAPFSNENTIAYLKDEFTLIIVHN